MLTAVYPPRAGTAAARRLSGRAEVSERLLLGLQSRCTCDNLRREWRDRFRVAAMPSTTSYSGGEYKQLRPPVNMGLAFDHSRSLSVETLEAGFSTAFSQVK